MPSDHDGVEDIRIASETIAKAELRTCLRIAVEALTMYTKPGEIEGRGWVALDRIRCILGIKQ